MYVAPKTLNLKQSSSSDIKSCDLNLQGILLLVAYGISHNKNSKKVAHKAHKMKLNVRGLHNEKLLDSH